MKNNKIHNREDMITYAMSFLSHSLRKITGIKEVIIYGSSVRGEADNGSDLDLFFDINRKEDEEEMKKTINEEIKMFYKTRTYNDWKLKGISNRISAKVGILNEWKLKRSIMSEGISLYSRFKETPKEIEPFTQFQIEPIRDITKRNKIMRRLFGRKENNMNTEGMIKKVGGRKLSPTTFIIPSQHCNEVIRILNEERIKYQLFEFWTDLKTIGKNKN
ncbi:hypothetical protein COU61_04900 [Candidatus Pacearchaeota archaeon CG10_big_fil_rev_8_21_14_0_10_35_13]|nr:MAG: hypothetical protein COU61_04900 [Candidatus Pacearchaeota archaeon CG10_big_fil_rev_8_21_14_0_10_35_13]